MRKYAFLKEPLKQEDRFVHKVMIYTAEEGIYLFEYDHPDAARCCGDLLYASMEELLADWDERIDERGWIEIEDPLPDCQADAFIPLRIKGRNTGTPEWGRYETLKDGVWVDYDPNEKHGL